MRSLVRIQTYLVGQQLVPRLRGLLMLLLWLLLLWLLGLLLLWLLGLGRLLLLLRLLGLGRRRQRQQFQGRTDGGAAQQACQQKGDGTCIPLPLLPLHLGRRCGRGG